MGEIREFLSTIRSVLPAHPVTIEIHESGLALAERSVFPPMTP